MWMCKLTTLPFPITNKLSIARSAIHVAQFLQYEMCWIKAVLDRLTTEQFVYARKHSDARGPTRTRLYPSLASSLDSRMSASHQAGLLWLVSQIASLCLTSTWVRLSWCWVGLWQFIWITIASPRGVFTPRNTGCPINWVSIYFGKCVYKRSLFFPNYTGERYMIWIMK